MIFFDIARMFRQVFRQIIAVLFIAAFFIPSVANLHVLSHLGDDHSSAPCKLCDVLVYSQQLNLIGDGVSYWESETQHIIPSSFVVYISYDVPQGKIVSPTVIYNKPPPNG